MSAIVATRVFVRATPDDYCRSQVGRARLGRVEIDELSVRRLRVGELEIAD